MYTLFFFGAMIVAYLALTDIRACAWTEK